MTDETKEPIGTPEGPGTADESDAQPSENSEQSVTSPDAQDSED